MSTVQLEPLQSQALESADFTSPAGGLIVYRVSHRGCTAPNRPFLKAINQKTMQVLLFQPDCKSWSCPHCAEIRARTWRYRAVHGCEQLRAAGGRMDFVTVTSHEKLSPSASLSVLSGAWDMLNKRVKRQVDSGEYLLVPEFHKNGRAHLHLLTTAILKKRWWKDNARECGFGYQSDVKEVNQLGGVSNYVSKYLTKMLENSHLPKHFRRVRTSRGWPKLPEMPTNTEWHFLVIKSDVALAFEQHTYQSMGYTVVLADGISAWDWIERGGVV